MPLNLKPIQRKEFFMVNAISGGGYDVASIWLNLFKKLDTSSDGTLDTNELASVAANLGTSAADIITTLDSDKDGVVGTSDFEAALSKLRAQQPPGPPPQAMGPSPEDIFNKIDQNGDGSISKDELSSFMAQNNSDVDKIFKEVDTDNDGLISRSESDGHLEKVKKEGRPQDSAVNNTSRELDWESKMFEKFLSSYDILSNGSAESTSLYA